METDSRKTVLSMLDDTVTSGRLSSEVVADTFAGNDFSARDRSFMLRLYFGVLERAVFLDYIIDGHCSFNSRKIKPVIRNILRMGIYQMLFMDSVPDRAALSESVRLAAARGFSQLKGFVNGILRSIQREAGAEGGAGFYLEKLYGEIPASVRCSVPEWMYDLLTEEYGNDRAQAFLRAALEIAKPVFIRFTSKCTDINEVYALLEADGCAVTGTCCLQLNLGDKAINELEAFRRGLIFVQDPGSVMAAEEAVSALEAVSGPDNPEPLILDVCAAPGGKALYAAEKLPSARVIARDISTEKISLIEENAARLGIANIKSQVWDATVPDKELAADLVIADLPCSGLGTMGGKPDIRLRVKQKDIDSLACLQREILKTVQAYVRKDGILAYSTCTVTPQENRLNAAWFAENFPFDMIKETQLLPDDGRDGFYSAIFRRRKTD